MEETIHFSPHQDINITLRIHSLGYEEFSLLHFFHIFTIKSEAGIAQSVWRLATGWTT
jgi:hypothetical protein